MGMNRQTLAQALEVGLRKIIHFNLSQAPQQWQMLCHMGTTNRASETDQGFTGFGPMNAINEGGSVQYDDMLQGYTTTYTPLKYGKGAKVTEEMIEDDQNRVIQAIPRGMTRSFVHTIEYDTWNNLNNAFSNTYTGGDAKELLATDHPLVGGGTQANELTTAANLSVEALEQAFIDLATQLNDRGQFEPLRPMTLIVPPALEFDAQKILQTSGEVGTANNDVNTMNGKLKLVVVPYLTSSTAWFLQCDQHEMHFLWRKRPVFGREGDFDTDNLKFKLKARWVSGWSDFRGMFGSPGV